MTAKPTIVWLRDDLRLADNPALDAAVERNAPVVVVYLLDDVSEGIRPLGGASRWWLHHSLVALAASLEAIGSRLVLRRGPAATEIPRLVSETDAAAVYWNRRYAASREIDAALKQSLRDSGVEVDSFHANLLFEPWSVTSATDDPFQVFTPFWKACLARPVPREPLPAPAALVSPEVASDRIEDWELLPTHPDWAGGLRERWQPGEASASRALADFRDGALADYHRRDEPGQAATSRLSPHLRFGEISPFQVWHAVQGALPVDDTENVAKFLSEVGWREFNWNILYHFPRLSTDNFRREFDAFPWRSDRDAELKAWQKGRTGIPLVDAGMRELWRTGYMHNRVRLVAASFLVKNLMIDWRLGERWFWDTLVDADEANNPANWQWVAGSGADPAPYFRVFNPLLQADKFDPERKYINTWIPADEPYPEPIVDVAQSRREALDAYESMRAARQPTAQPTTQPTH
ncbi:MAG TPA: deoxyribodipyrimidine photo-lyase [Glaciibacter sp.]|nr:deoxyribodipyrimidine photo-lyase [Glaciibacter sp.]